MDIEHGAYFDIFVTNDLNIVKYVKYVIICIKYKINIFNTIKNFSNNFEIKKTNFYIKFIMYSKSIGSSVCETTIFIW